MLAHLFSTGHAPLYAVLLASSSAALILPLLEQVGVSGGDALTTIAQVAVADTACIVALPLVYAQNVRGPWRLGPFVTGCKAAAFPSGT